MKSPSLLKQYSKHKPCYYCGAPPPSSREHAPVRSMFEAFDCDSITVPSCNKHNSEKNLDDRAIVAFLLKGLYFSLRKGSLTDNILKALVSAHPKLGELKEVNLRPLIRNHRDVLGFPLSHLADTKSVLSWIRQLTAALTWSVLGKSDMSVDWDNAVVLSPQYVRADNMISLDEAAATLKSNKSLEELLNKPSIKWWRGWSAYPKPYPPDIYRFEISFTTTDDFDYFESKNNVRFRHWFYSQFAWYAIFNASESTKIALERSVRKVNEDP